MLQARPRHARCMSCLTAAFAIRRNVATPRAALRWTFGKGNTSKYAAEKACTTILQCLHVTADWHGPDAASLGERISRPPERIGARASTRRVSRF